MSFSSSLFSTYMYQSTFPINGSSSFKEYFCGLIVYKYSLNLLPECIAHLYLRNDSIHEHNTRGCHEQSHEYSLVQKLSVT